MAFRFLHTADWQLGKPFAGFSGDIGAHLRKARFDTVANLASIAAERDVDAVMVAGDAFDSHLPESKSLYAAANAMRAFQGPWIVLPGNHDPADASDLWARLQDLASDIDLRLALSPSAIGIADNRAYVLPAPLQRRHDFVDPTAWMDRAQMPSTAYRIGLAHGSIREFGNSDPSPNLIDPTRATQAGLDYLALGDWHGTKRIDAKTWYAGTPEIDEFADNAPGHALLVTLAEPGAEPQVERIATTAYNWQRLTIEDVRGVEAIEDAVQAAIADSEKPDRLLLALRLVGTIDLAGRARLAARFSEWEARLAHLRLDDQLRDAPSEEDISSLARGGGLVATAARRLMETENDPAADLALRRLYELATIEGG